jgi:diaminopimelate epimerase
MCGNGSRCAARLAFELGLAPARHVLGTDAGPVQAEVDPDGKTVKVQLTVPQDLELNIDLALDAPQPLTVHYVNTGVPHCVMLCSDPASLDLAALGPAIRYHERFAPSGANVNLVQIRDDASLAIRTYERGVEAETFACGTGAAAAAVVANALGCCSRTIEVLTQGQERLIITLEQGAVFLQGRAVLVYSGQFRPQELELSV